MWIACPVPLAKWPMANMWCELRPIQPPILACFPVASHSSNPFICFFTKMLFKYTFSHSLWLLTCITPVDPPTNLFALSQPQLELISLCCQTARASAEPDWKKWPRKSERLSLLYIYLGRNNLQSEQIPCPILDHHDDLRMLDFTHPKSINGSLFFGKSDHLISIVYILVNQFLKADRIF
jgi:hypothetical protein